MHLMRVQGFYFTMLQYSHIQASTASFVPSMQLYRPRHKTEHGALQTLFRRFDLFHRPRYQTDTSGYNTTCATLERITVPGRHPHIPYTTVTPRSCTGQHSHRPCKPGGVSVSTCTGSARRRFRCFPRPEAGAATGSAVMAHRVSLAPSARRRSPAGGAQRAARDP